MLQRWLGTVLFYGEKQCNRMKGFAGIAPIIATIEAEYAEQQSAPTQKAARNNHGGRAENINDLLDNLATAIRSLGSNSKCNTAGPDGLRCCHANKMLHALEC